MQSHPGLIVNIGSYSAVPLQGLVLTTNSPGGCGQLTGKLEYRPPYAPLLALRENDRVEVFDAGGLVWRGRLEEKGADIQAGAAVWDFVALGYAASLRDQEYTTATTFAGGTAIEAIFTTVRDDLCPDISTDNSLVVATGRTLAGVSADMIGKTAQDVMDAAMQIGDSAGQRLYWHIWEGVRGANQEAQLELIARPTTPEYVVGLEQGARVTIRWALSRLANRIVVRWGAGPTYTTRNDTASQAASPDGYGVTKIMHVQQDLVNTATDAQNVGDALLAQFARVRAVASRIVIPSTAQIGTAGGGVVLPWRVRAGRMIRVRDLRPSSWGGEGYDFVIAGTSWDEDAQTLTVTPEGRDEVAHMIARYLRSERLT